MSLGYQIDKMAIPIVQKDKNWQNKDNEYFIYSYENPDNTESQDHEKHTKQRI